MFIRSILIAGILFCKAPLAAQIIVTTDSLFVLPDSMNAFTLDQFFSAILTNHPVAKQVDILSDVAKQEIRFARGAFDPELGMEFSTKEFQDEEYYSRFNTELKFPTIIPINPSIGFDHNTGEYLPPEDYISEDLNYRQYNVGVSIPLGRGLMTDERRAALAQARLFQQMTEAEQVKIINKLLLDGAYDYWNWYRAFNQFRLTSQGVQVASEIYRLVKTNHELGEAASIDTVQSLITLQQRLVEQQEAFVELENSIIKVSNALWDSLGAPLALDTRWAPVLDENLEQLTPAQLDELMVQAQQNHPELRKLRVKVEQLEVERRLAAEYLKPRVNVKYNILNQPRNVNNEMFFDPAASYKFGVDFGIPLFLRKERSKLAITKLKLSSTRFEQTVQERDILNTLQRSYNQLMNLRTIASTQRDVTSNYELLLNAELLNLREGESDLFRINVQQEKLIEAQSKWLKTLSEAQKLQAFLFWAAGIRPR